VSRWRRRRGPPLHGLEGPWARLGAGRSPPGPPPGGIGNGRWPSNRQRRFQPAHATTQPHEQFVDRGAANRQDPPIASWRPAIAQPGARRCVSLSTHPPPSQADSANRSWRAHGDAKARGGCAKHEAGRADGVIAAAANPMATAPQRRQWIRGRQHQQSAEGESRQPRTTRARDASSSRGRHGGPIRAWRRVQSDRVVAATAVGSVRGSVSSSTSGPQARPGRNHPARSAVQADQQAGHGTWRIS